MFVASGLFPYYDFCLRKLSEVKLSSTKQQNKLTTIFQKRKRKVKYFLILTYESTLQERVYLL